MKHSNVADQVTRVAVDLFASQGFANTSVQQIVAAAGVTKGAMYHYFQSKDDLLFGIYERMLSLQRANLEAILDEGGRPEKVLRDVCVDVIKTSIDFLPEGTVFFRSLHLLSEPRRAEVTRRRRDYHDRVASLIESGQNEGTFRTDIPQSVMIAHFFSDVHYLSHWYSPEGPEGKQKVAQQLTDLFLRSIRKEAS